MTTKLPNGRQQFFHPTTGELLVGGKVWNYIVGTSTLKDTWQDQAGTVLNTNPVVLDSQGSAAIWGKGAYRQLLLAVNNDQIWDESTTSGISDAMDPVTSASSLSLARTAFGISAPWQSVVGAATLSLGMATMGISVAMQPVTAAATLALARTALGVDSVGLSVYNVMAYGAVGNGIADDRAAIQSAIAACTSGIVYFPPGTYKILSTIFLKPGVAMWGTTPFSSTIVAGANNINIFGYEALALTTGFEILNLGFSGGGFSSCFGIFLNGVDATRRISIVSVTNCYFALLTQGVHPNFCANIVVQNCFANVCQGGFWFAMCADVVVVGCKAQNGAGIGFYVTGGVGAYDQGIRLLGCSTNGQVNGLAVLDQEWGVAVGCSFTVCAGQPVSLVNSSNWRLEGCEIAANAAVPGITVDATCVSFQMANCYIALNTFGMHLQGNRHGLTGNKFVGNTNVDIYLLNATQVTVTGNGCDSTGVPQSILEAGTANFNSFVGNCTNGTLGVIGGGSAIAGNVVY